MAIYCEELRLLYVQVPGTGCSVVADVMRRQLGGVDLGRKHNDLPEILGRGLLSAEDAGRCLVAANIRNPFDRLVTYYQRLDGPWVEKQLAWARRDLTRRLEAGEFSRSEYDKRLADRPRVEKRLRRRARIIGHVGFNTWLQTTLLRWKASRVFSRERRSRAECDYTLFPMLEGVDVVLRQESLEQALNELLQRLDARRAVVVPEKNQTGEKRHYSTYYSKQSRWLVHRLYGFELERFGYDFSGVIDDSLLLNLSSDQGRIAPF